MEINTNNNFNELFSEEDYFEELYVSVIIGNKQALKETI